MNLINAIVLAATTEAITVTSVGTSVGGPSPPTTGGGPSPPNTGGGSLVEGTCDGLTTGSWKFNRHGTGQSGLARYMDYMGVTAEQLTCAVQDYFTPEDMVNSYCMFCENMWYWVPDSGVVEFDNSVHYPNGAFPTHSSFYNKERSSKHQYKDYSNHGDDYIVGGYATEWGIYRAKGPYGFDSVPFNTAINYLLYAFLPVCGRGADGLGQLALCTVNDCSAKSGSNPYFALNQSCDGLPDGSIVIHDPWAAFNTQSSTRQGTFHHMMNAKAEYGDKITIMPSIGGWSLSKVFYDMHNDKVRQNFVNSAANLLTAWPFFDGIDIDWEFPGGLGADEGTVNVIGAAEEFLLPSKNGDCVDSLDPHGEIDLFSSYAAVTNCYQSRVDMSVTSYNIPPVGCSSSLEKRTDIAEGFKKWDTVPVTKDDYINCTHCDAGIGQKLFADLRATLDTIDVSKRPRQFKDTRKYQITTAISGAPDKINEIDYGTLVNDGNLDHIFIMSYDFMGAWGGVGHQTNLYNQPLYKGFSVHEAVQTLMDQGVPGKNIVVGVASYGRGWKGSFNKSQDLSTLFNVAPQGACDGDIEAGVVDYATILDKTKKNTMIQVWDECALADLTVGSNELYTGDSVRSVFAKGKYVQDNGLGGLFTWELAQDDKQVPLINAMNEALGRIPAGSSPSIPTEDFTTSSCAVALVPHDYNNRPWSAPVCE